jgi:hypothetical protein
MGYVVGISMLQPNNSVGFWVSGDGIGMRLDMLGATIDTGAYSNTLQVLAPIYGVQYFKMSGSQPKWKFCIKYYRRIYRQGMFMSEFPAHSNCDHTWDVWFPWEEEVLLT